MNAISLRRLVASAAIVFMAVAGIPWLVCWGPYYVSAIWFFKGLGGAHSTFHSWGARNWWTYSHFFWATLLLFAATVILAMWAYGRSHRTFRFISREHDAEPMWLGSAFSAVGMVLMGFLAVQMLWVPGKDTARHFNSNTTFELSSIEPGNTPNSAFRLVDGGSYNGDSIVTKHDIPSRVVQGELSGQGWLPRRTSLKSAHIFMSRSFGSTGGTVLREDTMAFIHTGDDPAINETEAPGYFSAVRDGSGKQVRPEGVVTWDGRASSPTICRFEGDNRLGRALQGERGNNLKNFVLEDHPSWFYRDSDVYGYCDGDKPYIVIPMLKYVSSGNLKVEVPAAVMRVSGSPSGTPQLEVFYNVEPGQIPGPVYPVSLAHEQRVQANWAAGRKFESNNWGYDEPNLDENSENSGEFLLLDIETNRPVYVTPLTPRSSDSEMVLAYASVPGDTMKAGTLNALTITVMDDRANTSASESLKTMAASIKSEVNRVEPGLFTSGGGKLREFTPSSDGRWVAFIVLDDGTPKYTVEIKTGSEGFITVREANTNKVVVERKSSSQPGSTGSGIDLTQVTDEELMAELQRRLNEEG